MLIKLEDIEVYYINEDLNKLDKKEREKRVNEIFKKEYQGKEISYFLKEKEIKALIN